MEPVPNLVDVPMGDGKLTSCYMDGGCPSTHQAPLVRGMRLPLELHLRHRVMKPLDGRCDIGSSRTFGKQLLVRRTLRTAQPLERWPPALVPVFWRKTPS